ncbi:MAG: hypothetical protein JRN15_17340 [Nitrososphaerota archaeon]|nr:hypothetical protein [Nitrososphaerota archaeon]
MRIFMVGLSTFFLALSSTGAEGKSIVNLYQLPLTVKDFVVGKVITPIVFGSVFGVVFFSIVVLLFPPLDPALMIILPVLAIAGATELAFVGLYVGARFPNFSEAPRASYISQTASLIAFPLAILMTGVSMSPLLFSIFFSPSLNELLIAFIATLVMTAVLSFVFFFVASRRVRRLLSELPF